MKIDRERLELAAMACRRGLMGLSGDEGSVFHGFPRAACGPASEILGRLLQEELGYDGVYVCGEDHPNLGQEQSHAWFEVGQFLVDITHDPSNWPCYPHDGYQAALAEFKKGSQ